VRRIAVFGSRRDPQVAHVTSLLQLLGHPLVSIDPEDWLGDGRAAHALRLGDGGAPRFDSAGGALLDCEAAWVRHLVAPSLEVGLDGPPVDRETLFVAGHQALERHCLQMAGLLGLVTAGRRVINPPALGSGVQNKCAQLLALAAAGVPVPETLVTDDPDAARAFVHGREAIFKPVGGAGLARRVDASDAEALDLIRSAPVIFQALAPGEDVRVTVIDGRVVSAAAIEVPPGTIDFRSDPSYARGGGRYRSVQLPPAAERAVLDATRALGLILAGLDLRIDPARPESFRVLEANPSPTWMDLEHKTGHRISEALVAALIA
jgi:hypothetical protein